MSTINIPSFETAVSAPYAAIGYMRDYLYGHKKTEDIELHDIQICGKYLVVVVVTNRIKNLQIGIAHKYFAIKTFHMDTHKYNVTLFDECMFPTDLFKCKQVIRCISMIHGNKFVFEYNYSRKNSGICEYDCDTGNATYIIHLSRCSILASHVYSATESAVIYGRCRVNGQYDRFVRMANGDLHETHSLSIVRAVYKKPTTSKYDFTYYMTMESMTFMFDEYTLYCSSRKFGFNVFNGYTLSTHSKTEYLACDITTLKEKITMNFTQEVYIINFYMSKTLLSAVITVAESYVTYVLYYDLCTRVTNIYEAYPWTPIYTTYGQRGDLYIQGKLIKAPPRFSRTDMWHKKKISDELASIWSLP